MGTVVITAAIKRDHQVSLVGILTAAKISRCGVIEMVVAAAQFNLAQPVLGQVAFHLEIVRVGLGLFGFGGGQTGLAQLFPTARLLQQFFYGLLGVVLVGAVKLLLRKPGLFRLDRQTASISLGCNWRWLRVNSRA